MSKRHSSARLRARPALRSASRSGAFVCAALGLFLCLRASPARAEAGDEEARQGLALAKAGQCVEALPLLEEAEAARHRPSTALVLADCYVNTGELLQAGVLYHMVADEKPTRAHSAADRAAIKAAVRKAREVDARIPTITFLVPSEYEGVEITLNGDPLERTDEPRKVSPDVTIKVVMRAKGRKERAEELFLAEGERRVIDVKLAPRGQESDKPSSISPKSEPRLWLGAGYRGYVVPRFVMNIFGDGGRTVAVPGGAATLTRTSGAFDYAFSLGYGAYFLGPTPFKPSGTPDTEYEIVESDLHALEATFEVRYNVMLDRSRRWRLRIGGGVGVGFTFLGGLYRTQAFPATLTPGDPYTYAKCRGPNDPAGSYRYCNQLDKDADHYDGYADKSWFDRGARPLVYPWVALPEIGISFHPSPRVAIDLDVATSLSGLMTSLGVRFGL
ncbi:tetratricopeptide repeat protein [Polyangium aurulentum]|uniref:tetratricopeptide repeat protein n=1 Tax=Polyangium aurulentum TaxID=2567896 RepID=UPI0010ADFEA2|nr:tetratricopeptide repeat protein [Polyangium aurulentum]UQA57900.1 tetratricopeptide repeat protein [Polyangium aurulentum]